MKKLRLYSVTTAMLFGGLFFTACEGDFDDLDSSQDIELLDKDFTESDDDDDKDVPGQN